MVTYPSRRTLAAIEWSVWSAFAVAVALVAGIVLYGALLVGTALAGASPTPFYVLGIACVAGTLAFVVISVLDA